MSNAESRPFRWLRAATVAIAACFAVVGVATLAAGLSATDTREGPGRAERVLAGLALDASIARRAPHLANPYAASDSSLMAGMNVYRRNCAGCHGGPSREPAAFGMSFFPRAPQFVLVPPRRAESDLFYLVGRGVRRTGMPGWAAIMPDSDIWRAVMFIHRMDSLPHSVDSTWRARSR